MAFFDKVTDFAKNISDKGSNRIEITRLKARINALEDGIPAAKAELGELLWIKYQQGESLDPKANAICAGIQAKLDEIASIQAEIRNIKDQETIASNPGTRPCPQCGALVAPENRFCPQCGVPVPAAEPVREAETARPAFCSQCGAPCPADARFCTNCGAAIKP